MNNDITTEANNDSLIGPQSSVNLMEPPAPDAPLSSFSVDVHDEDRSHVPDDITNGEDTSFLKRPDVKMWLYILAGTVVIFAIVFGILTRETSLFKGYAITEPGDVAQTTDEEDIFGQFNDRAADETSNDDDGTPQESTTDELIVDDAPVVGSEVSNEGTDVIVTREEENILEDNEPSFNDDFAILFDDGLMGDLPGTIPTIPDPILNFDFSDSLGSNTNANIMASSVVQGDTGPAIWIAMFPSLLYALGRKKK